MDNLEYTFNYSKNENILFVIIRGFTIFAK